MTDFGVVLEQWAAREEEVMVWFTEDDETSGGTRAKMRGVRLRLDGKVVGVTLDVPRGDDLEGPLTWKAVYYAADEVASIARRF